MWLASLVSQTAIVRAGVLLSGAAEFVKEGAGVNDTVLFVRPAMAVTVIVITVGLASELRGRRVAGEPRQSNGRSSVRACCSAERRSLSRRELMRTTLSCC